MTLNVASGISRQLKDRFPDFVVYTEEQEQGTAGEDAFYVLHTLSTTRDLSGRVWLHSLVTLRAVRLSSEGQNRRGLYTLGVELLEELQTVSVSIDEEWAAHTKDLQYEIVGKDLIVTFSVDFSAFLTAEEQEALIGEASINIYEKEE
jgi:hypothetical protein